MERTAREIVLAVLDSICIVDMGPEGFAEKTGELYTAAADYLVREFDKDELGLDYEDAEDLD